MKHSKKRRLEEELIKKIRETEDFLRKIPAHLQQGKVASHAKIKLMELRRQLNPNASH